MFIPIIALAKLIALGSLKFIFLLLGMIFFPRFALRVILDGATSMLVPALAWLVEHGRLDGERSNAILDDLAMLSNIELSASESRDVLKKLLLKMFTNLKQSAVNTLTRLKGLITK